MKRITISNKIKGFFTDSLWSIAGLLLMNVVAQFVVYPIWNQKLGSEEYGNIVFLLSLMNIVVASLGASCNYARMRASVGQKTNNRPYIYILTIGCILVFPIFSLMKVLGVFVLSSVEFVLFYLLLCASVWRTYADVEYRLNINYKGYFYYYLTISAGYLIGIVLFLCSGLWPLALLPGELAGLFLVLTRGTIFKRDIRVSREKIYDVIRLVAILLGSNILSTLVFNGDRLLLKLLVSGSAVTVYYVASLLGKTISLLTVPLNGVLMGYLAKYSGKFTIKIMHKITLLSVGIILFASIACTIGSHILIPFLYPQEYVAAKDYFFIGNLAQVIYFVSTVFMNSVLLRFARSSFQIYVNIGYVFLFGLFCVPLTLVNGVSGFCFGLLFTCTARFVLILLLCYKDIERI